MSLAISLADGGAICFAADTRAFSTQDGPLPDPIRKIRVLEREQERTLVALSGDTELNGKHLLDHASDFGDLFGEEGVYAFASYLNEIWIVHVETSDWDSPGDKEFYIQDARITFLIATNLNCIYSIDGKINNIVVQKYCPPQKVHAIGIPNLIEAELHVEPADRAGWTAFLAQAFGKASQLSETVSAPIDTVWWIGNDISFIQRYSSCDDLSENNAMEA